MEEIKGLKEILSDVAKRIENLENLKNDYELYLGVIEENYLIICFDCNGNQFDLGYITDEGKCYILYRNFHKENYELWLQNGMKVKRENGVEWRGKEYNIGPISKSLGGKDFKIYDFEFACPQNPCKDENIIRYSNETPILY